MFCKNCGKDIAADAKFCPAYRAINISCGTTQVETATQAVVQPLKAEEDKASIGMNILGFLIPIVGAIYFFVKKREFPNKAKYCLYSSIAGVVFWYIVYI